MTIPRIALFPALALALAAGPAGGQNNSNPPAQNGSSPQPVEAPNRQNNPPQNGENGNPAEETVMEIPPPVSGMALPTAYAAEQRSNYLGIGLMGGAAYVTNVFIGETQKPVDDEQYSIWPSLTLEVTNPRVHENFSYNPGFLLYQHTSALNQTSQNATGDLSYRFSPYSVVSVQDVFLKTSNVFSQPYTLSAGGVAGGVQAPTELVIAPYANQISNEASGLVSHQFSRTAMFGVGGGASELDYPDTTQALGLFNANSYNGNAFLNLRVTPRQYVGVTGNYSHITEYPATGTAETQNGSAMPYYAFYFRKNIYFSASAGTQYYDATYPLALPARGWSPAALASLHAATERLEFSLSYQRSVTAGGGLLGAFTLNSGSTDLRLRMTPAWSAGVSGGYSDARQLVVLPSLQGENGHSINVAGSLVRQLGQHLSAEVGYDFLHQDYALIPLIADAPNSQRVYGTIHYQLRRPIGR